MANGMSVSCCAVDDQEGPVIALDLLDGGKAVPHDPPHGQPWECALSHLHGGRKGALEDQGTERHLRGELERDGSTERLPEEHHVVWGDALIYGQPAVRCPGVAIHTRLIGVPSTPSIPAIVEHEHGHVEQPLPRRMRSTRWVILPALPWNIRKTQRGCSTGQYHPWSRTPSCVVNATSSHWIPTGCQSPLG